jgi:hypothetical protein
VLEQGRADLVVTLDSTGQHDATQIPHLIDQLLAEDLDVIIGSRWARASGTPGLTLRRWALGRTANLVFRWVTGIAGVTDVTTTFRIARIEVVRELDLDDLPVDARSQQMAFVAAAVGHGRRVGEGAILYRPPAASLGPGRRPRRDRLRRPAAAAAPGQEPAADRTAQPGRPPVQRPDLRRRRRPGAPRRRRALLRLGP